MEVVVKIDNSKFNEFKNLIKALDAEIISSYPDEIIVGSVEEVRKRVYEAENRVKSGKYVDEKEFDNFIQKLVSEDN
ncbi:hypothetical protein JCM11957_01880 [Caminibacter profundus]